MTSPDRSDVRNRLLQSLAPADFQLLASHLRPVPLTFRDEIEIPGQPIDQCIFPDTGILSLIASIGKRDLAEVGLIGFEGMSGIAVVHGTDRSPHRTIVQGAGAGWAIAVPKLLPMIAESAALKALFLLYSRAQTVQIAESALAFARFSLEERLARWILMYHDRHQRGDLHLTHELLSIMLGTRRAGVTTSLHVLEGAGMIRSSRRNITVRDRTKLIEAAGGSYGGSEAEYNRLFSEFAKNKAGLELSH